MIPLDNKFPERKRKDLIQKIIMIATQVDDFCIVLVHVLHDDAEEGGVLLFPLTRFF